MDDTLTAEPTAEEAAQIEQSIQRYLEEVSQLRDHMHRDQSEIERSRARTQAMLARLQAHLTQLRAN